MGQFGMWISQKSLKQTGKPEAELCIFPIDFMCF